MVANINSRKLIEVIKAEIKIRETKISELEEMMNSLEQKINEQDRVLSSIERYRQGRNLLKCTCEFFSNVCNYVLSILLFN